MPDESPAPCAPEISEDVRDVLCDRLDFAVMAGVLPIGIDFYQQILAAIFPNDFDFPSSYNPAPFFDERFALRSRMRQAR